MTHLFPPINLMKWVDDHQEYLKPPVCNKLVFEENGFYIMMVGGPNQRKDFHYNEGAEFFYQLKGKMILKLIVENELVPVEINEGEVYLLPPKIPHSPQRFENSIGLVVERKRLDSEKDGLQWYCDACTHLLYEEYFHLKSIEKDFPPIFDRFFKSEAKRTCAQCHSVMGVESSCN